MVWAVLLTPPYYILLVQPDPLPVPGCSSLWPSLRHSHFISPFSELPPSFQNPSGPLQPLSGSSAHQFLHLMRPSSAPSSPQDDPSPTMGQSSHSPWTPPGFLQARDGEGRAQSSWPSPLWELPLPQGNPAVLRAALPTDIKGASHMVSKASASPASFFLHQAPDSREAEAGPRDPPTQAILAPRAAQEQAEAATGQSWPGQAAPKPLSYHREGLREAGVSKRLINQTPNTSVVN